MANIIHLRAYGIHHRSWDPKPYFTDDVFQEAWCFCGIHYKYTYTPRADFRAQLTLYPVDVTCPECLVSYDSMLEKGLIKLDTRQRVMFSGRASKNRNRALKDNLKLINPAFMNFKPVYVSVRSLTRFLVV